MWQRFLLLTVLLFSSSSLFASGQCRDWLIALDNAVNEAGIHDAGSQRVEGYPHLRTTRWLTFLQREVETEEQQRLWLMLASEQAMQGWRSELSQLPPSHPLLSDVDNWQASLQQCIDELVSITGFFGVPKTPIADNYSRRNRLLGLYAITNIFARPSMNGYRDDMAQRFRRPTRLPIRHYLVEDFSGTPPTPAELAPNALDMPIPSAGAQRALLNAYAPVVSVANTLAYNQPGSVQINHGVPSIDYHAPSAYTWLSWTRYKGHNLLQLNYQFWFSERPKEGSFDLYGGPLDSIIWRVTLKPDGNVLFYDSIHGCGCYHKVYPVARGLTPRDDGPTAPVFYPGVVPNARTERISLVIEPDTHYIVRAEKFIRGQQIERYTLQDVNILRAMPNDQQNIVSLYDSAGLIPISQRAERRILWPLGVPSAGTMRQPGTHAIAFIGKRHFDDAQLVDVIFQ